MIKTFKINKSRLYSEVDYSAVLSTHKYSGFNLEYHILQKISLHSGAVCFFDAFNSIGKTKPFLQVFPKGKCTPFAMTVNTSEGKRVALCGLQFSQKVADSWKLAIFEEKDVLKLLSKEGSITSEISSGICVLGDFIAMRDYEKAVKLNQSAFHPLDSLINLNGSAMEVFNMEEDSSIAVFSSGWGESAYKSYIGFCGEEVVAILCDFDMLEGNKYKKNDEEMEITLDINSEELYQNNPNLSDTENHILKWSIVVQNDKNEANLFNAYSRRGYAYHSARQLGEALSDYLKAIEIGRKLEKSTNFKFHAWTLYDNVGSIYRELNKTDQAINNFFEAKSHGDSFYGGAYVNLIDIYLSIKEWDKALLVAYEMVSDRPSDPNAYNKRAEVYIAREDYLSAIKDLDILINEFKWSESIIDKCNCLSTLGQIPAAFECIEQYLVDNKANELYYYNKGLLHFQNKNYFNSYSALLEAISINPDYVPCLLLLIELDDLRFNFYGLIKWATKYIELRPQSEYGYSIRGTAHAQLKNFDQAVEDFSFIVENVSREPKYFCLLIKALIDNKQSTQAKKYLRQLKKIDESYYLNAYGKMYLSVKNGVRGERMLVNAFNLNPIEFFLSDIIDNYIKTKRFDKAEDCIKKLENIDKESETPLLKKISFYKAKNDMELKNREIESYISKFLEKTTDEFTIKMVKKALE